MNINPFFSSTFLKVWNKYFNNSVDGFSFNFITDVAFIKKSFFPFYSNSGGKLTNGIDYSIIQDAHDFSSKVFLVRDIPSYQQDNKNEFGKSSLKLKKVLQYEGYTSKLSNYKNLDDYMLKQFKSNSRSKFRRNMKRLEAAFNVEYKMYHGEISKVAFDAVFAEFYALLEKRYEDKQESCGELHPKLWSFYCELAYQMINEKTASLFVIYSNNKPIGITYSYHYNTTLIEALTVFDIDYYRYNIGHTTIYKMLEWSFQNGVQLFDYTQGDFEYKKRWSDSNYNTYFHFLYDSNSVICRLLVSCYANYFNLKRVLRDKKITEKYRNFKHKLGTSSNKNKEENLTYTIENENASIEELKSFTPIDINSKAFSSQRRVFYNHLYMNSEPAKNFKAVKSSEKVFYVYSDLNTLKIECI